MLKEWCKYKSPTDKHYSNNRYKQESLLVDAKISIEKWY